MGKERKGQHNVSTVVRKDSVGQQGEAVAVVAVAVAVAAVVVVDNGLL